MITRLGRWTPLCYHTNGITYALLSSPAAAAALLSDNNNLQVGSWSQTNPGVSSFPTTTTISDESLISHIKTNSVAAFVRQIDFEEINNDEVKVLNKDWRVYPPCYSC
ncbi:unnamed protein product [Absidia cylindrospora]